MTAGLRVLLADPDVVTRHALALLLRGKLGLTDIGEAPDGAALARALAANEIGLLLLDWSLPDRPACEALAAACRAHPRLRLVIMSINPDHTAQAQALQAVFINKASAAEQVLEQLRGLLASPASRA